MSLFSGIRSQHSMHEMHIAFAPSSPLTQQVNICCFPQNNVKRTCSSVLQVGMALNHTLTRRAFLALTSTVSAAICTPMLANANMSSVSVGGDDEKVETTPSGLRYYDFRVGTTGDPIEEGDIVRFHLTTGTTGARNGWKLASTYDGEALVVKVGDGSIVPGLDEALRNMRPGGRRRALVPPQLGYEGSTRKGPIPTDFASFQRFKNIYLNPRRAFVPDGKV